MSKARLAMLDLLSRRQECLSLSARVTGSERIGIARLALGLRALPALLAAPLRAPWIDPDARALHRALVGRPWHGDPDAMARAARGGEVAVLASALVPELAPRLAAVVRDLRRADAMLELGLARLADDLRDLDVPLALMKGSAAAALVYPESAQRQRRDLDLLVGDGLSEVRRVLLSRGWSDANDPHHGQDPRAVRAWNMRARIGGGWINLDLHRGLVHDDWCRPDIELMLASCVHGRAPLPVTGAADTFANIVIHFVKTGFHEPLKGWIDLVRLLGLVSPTELADSARAHRLVTATWLCLRVLERWFDTAAGDHLRALGRPAQAALVDFLARGEHATPERRPLARGLSYRLWPRLVRDLAAPSFVRLGASCDSPT